MEKRVLLALVLSFLVMGSYTMAMRYFYPDYGSPKKVTPSAPVQQAPPSDSKPMNIASAGVMSVEKDKTVRTETLKLLFNEASGGIREIAFPKFMDSGTHAPLKILSETRGDLAVTSVRLAVENGHEETASDARIETLSDTQVQVSSVQQGIKIVKNYTFNRSKYSADLKVTFENISKEPVSFRYELTVGPSVPARHSIDEQYIEANFFSKTETKNELRHVKESKAGKITASSGPVLWAATKDRHFSVIVKPAVGDFRGSVKGLGEHRFLVLLDSEKFSLEPGASLGNDFTLYLGPNELEELESAGLDTIVNFGKLDMIGRMLVGALELLHKIFRNYGLAIIALTALINLLLFPLTRVSFMSMKRMQLIQPQMTKLREQYKKNPEKLNKEMMELYKKHKVNPFGGCLPMLLQMPVFIALYVALSKSVILINSKLLWIKDLSSPDSVPLPFSLPVLGNEIHALPLIMCAGMFFQQKFTQIKMEGQDPAVEQQQKMMMILMPVMFGFIFYTMPSGLVLYWLTNTVIMTSYQLYLKNVTIV